MLLLKEITKALRKYYVWIKWVNYYCNSNLSLLYSSILMLEYFSLFLLVANLVHFLSINIRVKLEYNFISIFLLQLNSLIVTMKLNLKQNYLALLINSSFKKLPIIVLPNLYILTIILFYFILNSLFVFNLMSLNVYIQSMLIIL